MCGICGIINFNGAPVAESAIRGMMSAIKHRGPDDEGVFIEQGIGLGFVRLSIIDLSPAGHQPKLSQDERYVLVFNGEIYNYIELREELKQAGVVFTTQSDSEVLLNAYIHWKEECLDRFNGMFSFAVYDRQTQQVFCARDRFGVKPFYYYVTEQQFIFASEPVAILRVMGHKPKPDYQRIYDYLVFNRTDHDAASFFEGIVKLGHGHKLWIRKNTYELHKWYDLEAKRSAAISSPQDYYKLFCDSVALRMRSDVPVGLTLSGGLDSSAIASVLVKEFGNSGVNTFSAVYDGSVKEDETKYINLYKDVLTNMHFVRPDPNELLNELNDFINAQQEPFGSTSIYASYRIMKQAKGTVKVMLNGQGADECLAGYDDFYGIYYIELLKKLKLLRLSREILVYLFKYRSAYAIKACFYYLLPARMQSRISIRSKTYMHPGFVARYSKNSSIPGKIYDFKDVNSALFGHMDFKLEHLLKWDDRNTMRFGIEARNPFLDYRLVEGIMNTASDQKISNGYTKVILRAAMKGLLPEQIRLRKDKVGFSTPEGEWFRMDAFKKVILDLIESESFRNRNIVSPEKAAKVYQLHLAGKVNASRDIWKWVNLELWMRNFID